MFIREAVLSVFAPRKLEEPPFETCADMQHSREKRITNRGFHQGQELPPNPASDDNHDDETVDEGPISTSSQGYSMEFPFPDDQFAS
jgi:hypothetical protein